MKASYHSGLANPASGLDWVMSTKPIDTTAEGWAIQRNALEQLGGEGRVRTAIELSEAVREMQLQGILARNASWTRSDAVRWLLEAQLRQPGGQT
jgi:hypothetical protein